MYFGGARESKAEQQSYHAVEQSVKPLAELDFTRNIGHAAG